MADLFSSAVIEAGLDAAATEMFEVLRKTAMSPIIYEVLDVGTCITDAAGSLISSGAGIPSFIGVLDKSVKAILLEYGREIEEGDIFVTNDPNHGGVTHLNDVVVAEPVFLKGECIAWAASIAHWGDIGGRTPGSMAADTTEIVAEGLRIPIVRLFNKGIANSSIFDIIRTNSRLPDFVIGDLWAQVSAGRRASRIVSELCAHHGNEEFNLAISNARTRSERRARAGLSRLPNGVFTIEEPQDDGAIWTATIEITNDEFIVDLRGAPTESNGPHNTSRDGAVIACQMFFKALTDPERLANAGSFSPLKVLTSPGTIFHAGPTAAHAYYFETRIKLFDMLWHCLAKQMPERLPAGHFGTIFGTVIAGRHPDNGRRYTMVEPQMGGWGATCNRDGQSAMFSTSHGDTFNCPVEIAEARYGFEVVEKSLADRNSAHDKYHCGGAGVRIKYRMRGNAVLSAGYSHAVQGVWSIEPATTSGINRLSVSRDVGTEESHRMVSGVCLREGDVVEIETSAGGAAPKNSNV